MKPILLSDIMPYIDSYFTVNVRTGEVNPLDTYDYPEQYKIFNIAYDTDEDNICIMVEHI